MNPESAHDRRSIRLHGYDYAGPGAYFITIVTQRRICLFGQVDGGELQLSAKGPIALECWQAIPDHFANVELGTSAVMPNHLYGIIVIQDGPMMDPSQVGAQHAVMGPSLGRLGSR